MDREHRGDLDLEVKIKDLRTGKETNIKDENIVNEIKKIIWKYIKVNKIRGL